jgi:prophage DNA circulation protein
MSWRDRLKRANWRGVEFLTESHDAKAGQRLVVHELPGRDVPVVEDLGAKARTWRVTAYFIGADYDQGRNRLLAALEKPGADWLEHPWLGRVWVRAQDWSTSETNATGGMGTVSVEFVEGGGGVPQPRVDVVDVAQARIDSFLAAAVDWEPPTMEASTLQALLAQVERGLSTVRDALSRARLPLTMLAAVLHQVDSARELLREGLALPGQYARALQSISGALVMGDTAGDDARARGVAALAQQAQAARAGRGQTAGVPVAQYKVLDAEAVVRAQWCAAMTAQLALADYRTEAARDQALVLAMTAMDEVMPSASDVVFEAAAEARSALQTALTAQQLAPTQTRAVVSPVPSTVLAYQMGVEEDLLIARNGVAHPLFVQGVVRV